MSQRALPTHSMSLRTKLLLILSTIVMGAAVSASLIVYVIARAELEQGAKRQLRGDAVLLAELVQRRFDAELRNFQHWAAMPMVTRTALDYKDPELLSAFHHYFSIVIASEPYSSVYLINREGDCVACDDPRRLYHPYARNVVSKKPDARAGFAGTAGIGHSELSPATGRPVVPLTAPVWHKGKVVAILRTSVDMGRLNRELLASLHLEHKERYYMFDPSLPLTLPEGKQLHTPTDLAPYSPPPGALRAAFDGASNRVFRYRDRSGEHLVASSRMQHPPWVFLAAQPMSEILAPVRTLRQTTAVVVALMLGLLALSIFRLTAPVIRGIEHCRKFAADIRRGRLDRRLQLQSSDEVGQLARDLNKMARQLQLNHQALEEAEHKYRGIFESAVEGIFQTDAAGDIRVANPALADLLGAPSADDVVGRNALQFYGDPQRRAELVDRLRADGEVSGFAIEIRTLDSDRRQGLLHARAERIAGGDIGVIRGIIQDVTEHQEAEARERQARETEDLLLRTELEMLRYQINPHFLFNALNSLRELVISAPRDGVQMIEALAAFCRASLVNRSDGLSTITEEFAHAEYYLKIQQVRFGQRLQVEIEADGRVGHVPIPAFIIQPLVENAVKYGQKSGANPLGVQIHASSDGACCVVKVANTGRWFEPDREDTGSGTRLGLENVQRRLARHYGGGAELTVKEEGGWVIIKVLFSVQATMVGWGHDPSLKPDGRTSP